MQHRHSIVFLGGPCHVGLGHDHKCNFVQNTTGSIFNRLILLFMEKGPKTLLFLVGENTANNFFFGRLYAKAVVHTTNGKES